MALHRHRQYTQPGMPDFVAVFLLLLIMVPLLMWTNQQQGTSWHSTSGYILSCAWQSIHFNAQPNRSKVSVTYDYEVDGVRYEDSWVGMWPTEGPNALSEEQFDSELQPGRAIQVFYDPGNPTNTRLHDAGKGINLVYIVSSLILAALAAYYLFNVYPTWKS